MFPLCKTCADTLNQNPCTHTDQERAIRGTWCHVELMKAIEKGYEVLNIHEVWHWEQTTDELFKEYVDTFLKIRQEASGYPPRLRNGRAETTLYRRVLSTRGNPS